MVWVCCCIKPDRRLHLGLVSCQRSRLLCGPRSWPLYRLWLFAHRRRFHQQAFAAYVDRGIAIKRLSARLKEYDLAKLAAALDPTADLELDFLGASIGGGNSAFLKTVIPYIYYDDAPIVIEGPQTIIAKVAFTALDNSVDNVIQFQYQSLDQAI